jgi:hypothetical protein
MRLKIALFICDRPLLYWSVCIVTLLVELSALVVKYSQNTAFALLLTCGTAMLVVADSLVYGSQHRAKI